jgi:hypothetical protein
MFKPEVIEGRETLTMELSRGDMNEPIEVNIKTIHL